MTVIIHGDKNEAFETDTITIPHAIVELYDYCGGSMKRELFSNIIEGLIQTGTISDMVDVFNHLSLEDKITKIYAFADVYFTANGGVAP